MEMVVHVYFSAPEELVWRYADFILEKDSDEGVKIFMKQQTTENDERDEKVVAFLSKYPKAHLKYLEHLVLVNNSQVWSDVFLSFSESLIKTFTQVEKFHTQLASTYIDLIESGSEDDEEKDKLKEKFRGLIVQSNLVRGDFLLSRLEKTDMHGEKAILYGKVSQKLKFCDCY